MQLWQFLIIMMTSFTGPGKAEMMPDLTGGPEDFGKADIQTEVKESTNVFQRYESNSTTTNIKRNDVHLIPDEGPFRSNYQTLQRQHRLFPIAQPNSQLSESSPRPTLRSSKPLIISSNSQITHPSISTANLRDKASDDKDNIFKRHLDLQRSYHELLPTKVTSTTHDPNKYRLEEPTNGIKIKHKGHSLHESSLAKINNQVTNNGPLGRRLKPEMLQVLVPRERENNEADPIRAASTSAISEPNDIQPNDIPPELKQKKIVKKNAPRLEAHIIATSGVHYPPGLHDGGSGSPSVPVVIITTQIPFVKRMMHKKLVESRTIKNPRTTYRDPESIHNPLHSMYGPPYDHYKFSAHKSPGGSFPPTKPPLYQSDKSLLQEHFPLTEKPYSLPESVEEKYYNSKTTSRPLKEESLYPATSPLPTVTPNTPTVLPSTEYTIPPVKKAPKVLTYKNADDPYFQPYDHPTAVTKKKTYAPAPRGKSVSGHKPSTQRNDLVERYSAISEGIPGVDYPIYHRVPYTSFNCKDKRPPGIYADEEAECQVWHICEADGRQHSFLCPNGTIFNQELLTCDWWYNVHCSPPEDKYQEKLDDAHEEPYVNDIPPSRSDKLGKSLSSPKPHQKSSWSTYSSPKSSEHPLHSPYPDQFTPPPPIRRPILSPRGFQGLHPITPFMQPTFLEFQPYQEDTYPMFQLRKRQAKEK
ncbi:uncharacterized protein [Palaemon carinicauda]|uniref:uncharacterized protein n=1 Tax=Palaemon carinicauda TaxID=392227 RepID=UPI0035B5D518